jgi:hypothetical protein
MADPHDGLEPESLPPPEVQAEFAEWLDEYAEGFEGELRRKLDAERDAED